MNNKLRVLYVEDDQTYLKATALPLSRNFDLETATDERQGLEKIAEHEFDVVISDGNLNRGGHNNDADYQGGLNVLRAAKTKGAYTIGLSSEPERFKRIAGEYIDLNYHKPYDIMTLISAVSDKPSQKDFEPRNNCLREPSHNHE